MPTIASTRATVPLNEDSTRSMMFATPASAAEEERVLLAGREQKEEEPHELHHNGAEDEGADDHRSIRAPSRRSGTPA